MSGVTLNRYPPYTRFSPYFYQGKSTTPIHDAVWNRQRAGTCIGDVFYDFLDNKTYVLGTANKDGYRTVKLTLLNGPDHRHIHPSGQPAYPLFIVNNQGIYKLVTPAHYFQPKHAAFVLGEIIHVPSEPTEVVSDLQKFYTIFIREGANGINSQNPLSTKEVHIKEGDVVVWKSQEGISSHVFFSGSHDNDGKDMGKEWMSPIIEAGGLYMKQFKKAGVYKYTSPVYKWINGTIVVSPVEAVTPPMPTKESDRKLIESFRRRGWSWNKILAYFEARKRG